MKYFFIEAIQSIASCQFDLLQSLILESPLRYIFHRRDEQVETPVPIDF